MKWAWTSSEKETGRRFVAPPWSVRERNGRIPGFFAFSTAGSATPDIKVPQLPQRRLSRRTAYVLTARATRVWRVTGRTPQPPPPLGLDSFLCGAETRLQTREELSAVDHRPCGLGERIPFAS